MGKDKGTIVVTGGCGYIGSHTIVEILEKTEHDVVSIDNLSNSSASSIERIKAITGRTIKNYNVDLCDKGGTFKVFENLGNITGVVHFAALKSVPESVEQPLRYYHNNIESLINVLDCCKSFNIQNFIFSSSCSVYGNVDQLPVNEDTALNKTQSPYGHTKQVGEEIIDNFAKSSAVSCLALRYFNPVGAHMSGKLGEVPINPPTNLIPVITQTAAGLRSQMMVFGDDFDTRDGSCIRDYVHVSDIARAHLDALDYLMDKKNAEQFEIFNLGTGTGVTVLEALKVFERNTGIKPNYKIGERREGDVAAIFSDCQKAKELLKWKALHSLDDMISSAWAWQKNILKEI